MFAKAAFLSLALVLTGTAPALAQDPAGVDRAMEAAQPCAAFSMPVRKRGKASKSCEPKRRARKKRTSSPTVPPNHTAATVGQ